MDVPTAQFSTRWKIEWSQFNDLANRPIHKGFSTVYNDLVLHWKVEISTFWKEMESTKFGFHLWYVDGPHASIKNVNYLIGMTTLDRVKIKDGTGKYEAVRGTGWGFYNFAERDSKIFKERHGFQETNCQIHSNPLYCQIVMKIPMDAFSFTFNAPIVEPTAQLMQKLFVNIADPDRAEYSNAKMISNQGDVFYCHHVILGPQSQAMAAMFRHPTAENKKPDEFEFPELGTNVLRALLEFFYTGRSTFDDFSTKEIIDLADAAEQYGLINLKQSCRVALWNRASENPRACFDIACFADLHSDMVYVKHRALEVLARNYENPDFVNLVQLDEKFGRSLKIEFETHLARRIVLGVIPITENS